MRFKAAISSFIVIILVACCFAQLEFTWHIIEENLYLPSDPVAVDLDGDEDLDIVCGTGEPLSWWENEGGFPFSFVYREELPDNFDDPLFVRSADIDNDGDMDIVANGRVGLITYYIKWWENDGQPDPTFLCHDIVEEAEVKFPLDVADLDNDGDQDILSFGIWREGHTITRKIVVYENSENGQFNLITIEIDIGVSPLTDISAYDIDDDGDLDIIFSTQDHTPSGYRWMENLGNMDFESDIGLTTGLSGHSFDIADLDNDDDPDIITTSGMSGDEIFWLENTGLDPPDFEYHFVDWHIDPTAIKAGDLDNDGDIDIMISAGDPIHGNWGEITYRLNDGEQNFEEYILVGPNFYGPYGQDCFIVEDMDLDGDLDVLATAGLYPMLAWFENHLIDAEIEPFHLESPEPGFTTPDTQVVLVWNQAIPNFETGITYHIKCHDHPDNDEIIAEITDTIYVFTGIPGTQYFWDVKAVADNGLEQWAEEQFWHFTIVDTTNSVDDPYVSSFPTEFAIQSVYPNPFNASTTITVALPQPSHLSLQIFNTTGQKVSILADGQYSQGYQNFVFNASGLSSGIYFVQMATSGNFQSMKKVLLIK